MITKLYRLTCDHCGSHTPLYPTLTDARKGALNVWRWTRRKKEGTTPARDLCPKCSRR